MRSRFRHQELIRREPSQGGAPPSGIIAISFGLISYSAPVVRQVFEHVHQLYVANLRCLFVALFRLGSALFCSEHLSSPHLLPF